MLCRGSFFPCSSPPCFFSLPPKCVFREGCHAKQIKSTSWGKVQLPALIIYMLGAEVCLSWFVLSSREEEKQSSPHALIVYAICEHWHSGVSYVLQVHLSQVFVTIPCVHLACGLSGTFFATMPGIQMNRRSPEEKTTGGSHFSCTLPLQLKLRSWPLNLYIMMEPNSSCHGSAVCW